MGGRTRIIASLFAGFALVAGAYFYRGASVTANTNLEDPRAFVAKLPLREYQEPADTDGDGLRDWLEELAGTNPRVNDAERIASSTASSAPFTADTATEKFAVSFFEEMVNQHGGNGLSDAEKKAVLDKSLREFTSLNETKLYTRSDITILTEESDEAVRTYGNAAGNVIVTAGSNPEKLESEIVLLQRALSTDDAAPLADIGKIKKGYDTLQAQLLAVPVPAPLIDEHLLLVNSITAIRDDVAAFERAFDDPLMAYVRFKRYQDDTLALANALEGIRKELERHTVIYDRTEAGGFFFSLRP